LFDGNATKLGREFVVSSPLGNDQYLPCVASLTSRSFLVTWTQANLDREGGPTEAVYSQIYGFETASNDLSGDGISDILFRSTSGQLVSWTLKADGVGKPAYGAGGGIGGAGAEWQIQGLGDFNGDGRQDVLWRNVDGTVAQWQLDGTSVVGGGVVAGATAEWSIVGIGDFDGDGTDDVLWRNSVSGLVLEWQQSGTTIKEGGAVGSASIDWTVKGTGDFNGDGKDDILWQHADGTVVAWLLDGTGVIGGGVVAGASAGWTLQGIADFDGDGKDDLLWRYTSGATLVWQLDGTTIKRAGSHGAGGTDWSIQGTGDYNGDGLADILWHHGTSGAVLTWTTASDGFGTADVTGLGAADPRAWTLAGAALL